MKNKLPYCILRIVFQTKCKLLNFFTFKDKVPVFLRSDSVYKFKCNVKVRLCKHLAVFALTRKGMKRDNDSPIKERYLFCNHSFGFDDFFILASNNIDLKVTLMESLSISRGHPPLNKNSH